MAFLQTLLMPIHSYAKPGPKSPAKKASTTQSEFAAIIVNGRTLSGPNSTALRQNGNLVIPVGSLARSLGDVVSIDVRSRIVSVKRQTGALTELDGRLGQIRENGLIVLSISNANEFALTPNLDQLYLPVGIVSVLFEVAIRYDEAQKAFIITRGQVGEDAIQSRSSRSVADLYKIDYDYNLSRYSSFTSHNLVLTAIGRIGDGRFYFSSNSSSTISRRIWPRSVTFSLERPNGQRYTGGDFGTGTNLQFLAANIRGGMAAIPFRGVTLTAFAGRANSGTVLPQPLTLDADLSIPVREQSRYDTNVFGFYATTSSVLGSHRPSPLTLSFGGMRFAGPSKKGEIAAASANYGGSRLRLQADIAIGKFDGINSDNIRIKGIGSAIDLSGTLQVTDNFAVQARYAYIGRNFLGPQSGVRDPIDLKAAGVTYSPTKWLSASFNGSTVTRPGDASKRDNTATAAFGITPGGTAPRFYFSHTQSSSAQGGSSAFTLFNATKDFSRLRFFLNATRIKTLGTVSTNAQFGANFLINDANSIEFSQGIGSKRSFNGQLDWRTSNLFGRRLSFSAGAGYSYGPTSKIAVYERFTASVNLPGQSTFQISYMQTNAGPTLLVSIRGTLFRKREASAFLNSSISEVNSFAKISGRVYQDLDMNGHYDAGIDRPQSEVKVRFDGNRYVVSDESGIFRFDSVTAGDHKIYLDLLSVRADLTLLNGDAQVASLRAGRETNVDFRLVRTGRVRGRVWLDLNENGKFDEGEKPLADVRVMTGSGRDTLTDVDGFFFIGDLAPGEHTILIDEKTLPEKTRSARSELSINVFPGRETADIDLAVMMIPAEIKRFGSKSN